MFVLRQNLKAIISSVTIRQKVQMKMSPLGERHAVLMEPYAARIVTPIRTASRLLCITMVLIKDLRLCWGTKQRVSVLRLLEGKIILAMGVRKRREGYICR